MTPEKIKVLIDYGMDGLKFIDDVEFETVDEAVKTAIGYSSNRFFIVKVIDWKAS